MLAHVSVPFQVAGNFYSSSDSESEDEIERKIHVEIKPLNNGTAPISASVDELRATVENLSLSPIGALSVRKPIFTSLHNSFFASSSFPLGEKARRFVPPENDERSVFFSSRSHAWRLAFDRKTPRETFQTHITLLPTNTADISFSNLFAYPCHELFFISFHAISPFFGSNLPKKNPFAKHSSPKFHCFVTNSTAQPGRVACVRVQHFRT